MAERFSLKVGGRRGRPGHWRVATRVAVPTPLLTRAVPLLQRGVPACRRW